MSETDFSKDVELSPTNHEFTMPESIHELTKDVPDRDKELGGESSSSIVVLVPPPNSIPPPQLQPKAINNNNDIPKGTDDNCKLLYKLFLNLIKLGIRKNLV